MKQYNWKDVPGEQLNPLMHRQMIHGEKITIARLRLAKGAIVPMHDHVNEQITMLESGRLRFEISGEEFIVTGGEALTIPPSARHMVEALEDSVAVDVFSPVREDWLRGDDAYLRQK